MLDVLRQRERIPERPISTCDIGAVIEKLELARTPITVLALMLAIGTGRFRQIGIEYETR